MEKKVKFNYEDLLTDYDHSIENKASANVLKKLGFEFIKHSKIYITSRNYYIVRKIFY